MDLDGPPALATARCRLPAADAATAAQNIAKRNFSLQKQPKASKNLIKTTSPW
ncbi:MAG: hypothetical protein Q4A28_08205 [Brachymonas sp.]|nr:hypothetical protein [Brachymonas sp.]